MADPAEPENLRDPDTQSTAQPMRVFISYASADAAVAGALVESLEQQGIACWISPRDVKAGALYADAIVRAISGARALVLVLSESAIGSSHVGKEVERASSKKRPIVALRIDKAPLTPALEYFLSESQWIEAQAENKKSAYARLIDAIREPGRAAPEISPDVTRSAGTASGAHLKSRRNRILLTTAFAVLAVALVSRLADRFWFSKHAAQERPIATTSPAPATGGEARPAVSEKSVAVLPFLDMSEKHDQEYFADGMAEEIIDLLAKVRDLRVPARTSSFYFKGKSTKIPDIARDLGVAHVLEGSIRRSGNRLRVTAQLIRADNGYHLWSETYDRDVHDIFKVQDDIANAVVQALQITLMGGPLTRQHGGTQNLEAYQLYVRARGQYFSHSRSSVDAARKHLEQATKLDPNFALAWTMLGRAVQELSLFRVLPMAEGFERARQCAQRGLALSPELSEARLLLAYVYRTYDWDWIAAQEEIRQVLAVEPSNSLALRQAGQVFATIGRFDDAERQLRAALVRDPLDTITIFNLGVTLYRAGRLAEAEGVYRRLDSIAPGFVWTRQYLARTLVMEGKPEAALAVVAQESDEQERSVVMPIVLRAAGRLAESDGALRTLIAKFADTQAFEVARTYAHRGDYDLTFQWLERAYKQQEETTFVEIVGEPMFKGLVPDPRYKALLRKMKLPQ